MQPTAEGTYTPTDYRIIATTPTTELVGGSNTREVVQVEVRLPLWDVTFFFRVPRTLFTADGVAAFANPLAEGVAQIAGVDYVQSITGEQDVAANGNLADFLRVFVASPDGELTDDVLVPMSAVNTPTAFALVQRAYDNLRQIGGF